MLNEIASSSKSISAFDEKLLIDIAELAHLTSLSVRHLRRLDSSRDIPGRMVHGRRVLFQTKIIRDWVRAGLPDRDTWRLAAKAQRPPLRGEDIVSATRWLRVNASKPCPVCNHPDWCRVTTDGALAGCMRIDQGCFRTKDVPTARKFSCTAWPTARDPRPTCRPGPAPRRSGRMLTRCTPSTLLCWAG